MVFAALAKLALGRDEEAVVWATCQFAPDIGLWPPALDGFIADLFATGLDGFDSKATDHLAYVRGNALNANRQR